MKGLQNTVRTPIHRVLLMVCDLQKSQYEMLAVVFVEAAQQLSSPTCFSRLVLSHTPYALALVCEFFGDFSTRVLDSATVSSILCFSCRFNVDSFSGKHS